MACDCIEKINESLNDRFPEAKLETVMTFPEMKEKLFFNFSYKPEGKDKRKNNTLLCTYCPFCGKLL